MWNWLFFCPDRNFCYCHPAQLLRSLDCQTQTTRMLSEIYRIRETPREVTQAESRKIRWVKSSPAISSYGQNIVDPMSSWIVSGKLTRWRIVRTCKRTNNSIWLFHSTSYPQFVLCGREEISGIIRPLDVIHCLLTHSSIQQTSQSGSLCCHCCPSVTLGFLGDGSSIRSGWWWNWQRGW
jgi:hypothetical protein